MRAFFSIDSAEIPTLRCYQSRKPVSQRGAIQLEFAFLEDKALKPLKAFVASVFVRRRVEPQREAKAPITGRERAMGALRTLGVVGFFIAVAVFLIATNVRWVINAPLLYSYGFDKYDIPARTGMERDELLSAARQIRDYFNNDDEYITVSVIWRGIPIENLYNDREVLHMKDVKGLVQGVYLVQMATGAYLAGFAIIGFVMWRGRFRSALARYLSLSGIITAAGVVLVGLASLVGFAGLFRAFHLISFTNDLWLLDPRKDYLIIMFPQGFFLDATIWIAGATLVEAVLLIFIWWRPRMVRQSVRTLRARIQGTQV